MQLFTVLPQTGCRLMMTFGDDVCVLFVQAPDVAKRYWGLADDAGMRELLLAVRADEAGECCFGG